MRPSRRASAAEKRTIGPPQRLATRGGAGRGPRGDGAGSGSSCNPGWGDQAGQFTPSLSAGREAVPAPRVPSEIARSGRVRVTRHVVVIGAMGFAPKLDDVRGRDDRRDDGADESQVAADELEHPRVRPAVDRLREEGE